MEILLPSIFFGPEERVRKAWLDCLMTIESNLTAAPEVLSGLAYTPVVAGEPIILADWGGPLDKTGRVWRLYVVPQSFALPDKTQRIQDVGIVKRQQRTILAALDVPWFTIAMSLFDRLSPAFMSEGTESQKDFMVPFLNKFFYFYCNRLPFGGPEPEFGRWRRGGNFPVRWCQA